MEAKASVGIKETKEAISGVMLLGALLYKKFSDGVQVKDFTELWDNFKDDTELQKILLDGYNEASLIPAEIKDLDMLEGAQLGMHAMGEVAKIIELLAAPAPQPAPVEA